MRNALLIGFIFLVSGYALAQEKVPVAGDLKKASTISVNQLYRFNTAAIGYGSIKEIRLNPRRSEIIFREERNSAWFNIDIPFSGILTFDLTPHQVIDDYDWMLYQYSSNLEKNILQDRAVPIRSNNARNNPSLLSKTGLNNSAAAKFSRPGPGDNYSSALKVRAGDKLALITDNIYGGKGFDLSVSLKPDITERLVVLQGVVKDRITNQFLEAEITVEDDSSGVRIAAAKSNAADGRYEVKVPVNRPINISACHPDYIFATTDTVVVADAERDFLLVIPAAGSLIVLNNIHFFPNKDEILSSSKSELERLLLFMKTRPEWNVKITGHTNTNVFAPARYLQQLSFNRAIAVKKYLTENAIEENRISCAGQGGKSPLVITKDPQMGLRNLRVEVTLVKNR